MKSFWNQKNIFVTGATGILGSCLTKYLADQNANVVILLRDQVPNSELIRSKTIQRVAIARGSLESYADVERAMNEYEIDTCFHLGAQAIVSTANRSPMSTFVSNIQGTWNVLEATRNSRLIKRIVVASSDKAYGDQKKMPYMEEMPLQGTNPYDVSKSCTDLIAKSYYKTYGLPLAIARLGNIFGEGDLNFNRIVPGTIRDVLHGRNPVIRSDGKFVRDYFYVKDAIRAYLLLGRNMHSKTVVGEAFNFGGDNKLTVLQIVKKISTLMSTKLKPKILNKIDTEIREQWLDTKKAKRVLGWKPYFSLEEGLKETIGWYKAFFKKR